MAAGTDALSRCKARIDGQKSFVLQGGAGSGKTESLKELLLYIKENQPRARVVCITHTNAAVAEIVDRVGEEYAVSTIHAFLYELIVNYRKNIWQVIPTLFQLEHIPGGCRAHQEYKKLYLQYKRKCYDIFRENSPDVVPKRTYDKDPAAYNQMLNQQIAVFNQRIAAQIAQKDPPDRFYNQTQFNSFGDVSFGHDGLLLIFHGLFERYPLFRRILRDKYDFIFIDEYQDTNAVVLRDLLALAGTEDRKGPAVCLFGDHMQSIYEKGIDELEAYISGRGLEKIPKEDNYRCSYEVIGLINSLRMDDVRQKVVLKAVDGIPETEADRHGSARMWYTVVGTKPNKDSTDQEKQRYHRLLERLIAKARTEVGDPSECKVLILTNKEIAEQNGFARLYQIFSDRYTDARDRIENYLRRIQALEVAELCRLYRQKKYNELICRVRQNGYEIYSAQKKMELRQIMETLTNDQERSMWDAVQLAAANQLIRQTEACSNEAARKDLRETDPRYTEFCRYYENGGNTYPKLKKAYADGGAEMFITSAEEFTSFERRLKRERFYRTLFSDAVKFAEIRNYDAYLEEETEYVTMHRTKGTSIRSVIVVMDEFSWKDYDFGLIYDPAAGKEKQQEKSQKLIYVACSRARKDLVCIRVLTAGEEAAFTARFSQAEKIDGADLMDVQ